MPRGQRARMRQMAQAIRVLGESVTLLINNESQPSATTPLSIVDAQIPPLPSTDQKVVVYAKVSYHDTDDITYAEPGKVGYIKASIEVSYDAGPMLFKCYGIELTNGTILRKTKINTSEGRSKYVMEVEGYENTVM